LQTIQKLQVATAQFPNNIPLQKIQKQKTLDWLQLTPEETAEVMNFDDQQPQMPPGMPPNGAKPPVQPALPMKSPMPQPIAA
jgi:hypothetical protein